GAGGVTYHRTAAQGTEAQAMPKHIVQRGPHRLPAPPAASADTARTDVVVVSGRVLDREDQPVAGAKLYLTSPQSEPNVPPARATTGTDGRFQFQATKAEFKDPKSGQDRQIYHLIAVGQDHAPDWIDLS